VHHDRELGPVRADPRQLEQVIMNLAVNARDAIQERGGGEQATGTLSFATRRMEAADIRRLGNEIIPEGAYTVLSVEDTGGGIPRGILPKIFEPFFTTKELGKGTGLGLSTVYGIVKQSGGFIFAENVVGEGGTVKGARFSIFLPVYAATPEELRRLHPAPQQVPDKARDWSGGGRILLVEDEDMVRAIAERSLTRQGYEVVTARDGDEGLEAFRTGGPFDMVVSDVVMPGTGGPAMARAIREAAPGMPVLFMSGYAEGQLRDEIDLAAVHFIAKPFSVRDIADKVGEVMADRRGRR
jgi:two-component system cell cycle sensor histidine kinase/response regulator CckA